MVGNEALLPAQFVKPKSYKMKRLYPYFNTRMFLFAFSVWANKHPVTVRLFIAFTHVAIAFLGIEGGLLLYARGVHIPHFLFYLPVFIFTGAYLAYPHMKGGSLEAFLCYRHRKITDAVLIGSLSLMWLLGGNSLPEKLARIDTGSPGMHRVVPTALSMLPSAPPKSDEKAPKLKFGFKAGSKWLAKRIEKRLDRYKKAKNGDVAGIIVLGVLLTIVLGFLAVAGACGLACAGNDVAAVLVLLLGGGAIAALWVGMVKWIRRVKAKAAANR